MGSPAQYVAPADLPTYVASTALATTSAAQQLAACKAANEWADSYLRGRYGNSDGTGGYVEPVLVAWGTDVTANAAYRAIYLLLASRGFDPRSGADQLIVSNNAAATAWFEGVQRQRIHPNVTPNVTLLTNSGPDLPQVNTSVARGWGNTNSNGVPSV